jgi:hypothetical protein
MDYEYLLGANVNQIKWYGIILGITFLYHFLNLHFVDTYLFKNVLNKNL